MRIENVSIVGMGALGVLFGDMLARALGPERVGFVADAARRSRYAQTPVTVNGRPCAFRTIDPAEPSGPDDLVIFAVKGPALERAMADAGGRSGPAPARLSRCSSSFRASATPRRASAPATSSTASRRAWTPSSWAAR